MISLFFKTLVILVGLMAILPSAVLADRDRHDRKERSHPDSRIDKRYDHNRSYLRDGYVVNRLPERRRPIHYKNRDYFYFGGVWYLPSGPNFVVTRPPLGIVVPILPSFYTTIWFGGVPYYYANEVYYMWRSDLNGYQVTVPPESEKEPELTYLADQLFIYPKQGQSKQQQADDRYACHSFGVEQTGYDPTQPPTNLSADSLKQQRKDYQRAMKACLEGKGYSVR